MTSPADARFLCNSDVLVLPFHGVVLICALIQKTRTMKEFVLLILTIPILHAVMPVTFACDSCHVTSYRKSRRTRKGPEMCAVDRANKTTSPFSLQDCSLDCTTDLTCSGFNIKDSYTCDLYNYNPKITVLYT